MSKKTKRKQEKRRRQLCTPKQEGKAPKRQMKWRKGGKEENYRTRKRKQTCKTNNTRRKEGKERRLCKKK